MCRVRSTVSAAYQKMQQSGFRPSTQGTTLFRGLSCPEVRATICIDFVQLLRCTDDRYMEETMKNRSKDAPRPRRCSACTISPTAAATPRRRASSTRTCSACRWCMSSRTTIVPSTGEYCPYVHLFFEMTGRLLHRVLRSRRQREARAVAEHAAPGSITSRFKVPSVERRRDHEGAARGGTASSVLGVTDHGFVKSIYFFDPNGIRLEFTAETASPDELKEYARSAFRARGVDQGKGRGGEGLTFITASVKGRDACVPRGASHDKCRSGTVSRSSSASRKRSRWWKPMASPEARE